MSRKAVLEVRELETTFFSDSGKVAAVDRISFSIHEGEILAIVGESGCGKSVTSLSIMGLVPSPPGKITNGEILLKGQDISKFSDKQMRKIRGNEIAMIFQEPMTSLNPLFTIGNQLIEAIRIHHPKWSKKEATVREGTEKVHIVLFCEVFGDSIVEYLAFFIYNRGTNMQVVPR